MFLNVKVY